MFTGQIVRRGSRPSVSARGFNGICLSRAPCHNIRASPIAASVLGERASARVQRQSVVLSSFTWGSEVGTRLSPSRATAAYVQELSVQDALRISVQGGYHTPTHVRATGRIVAIGDLHGDWHKAVDSFRAASLIDINEDGEIVWTGGDAVVVQLGDVMDRGDHEIAIVMLLRNLHEQAEQQGGAVYMLNGNHESLNVCGDFRYVTPGAFVESAMYAGLSEQQLGDWNLLARVRYSVYRPGGPMALELAKNPTVLVVNDTVFVHGGLLPVHVNYGIDKLNQEVSAWMRAEQTVDGGKAMPPFLAMGGGESVMWNRSQSKEYFPSPHDRYRSCQALSQALAKLGASRLVVGHTPQVQGANCECEGQVWRMDVGMSYGVLNRPAQVLQISRDPGTGGDLLTVLSSSPLCSLDEECEVPM